MITSPYSEWYMESCLYNYHAITQKIKILLQHDNYIKINRNVSLTYFDISTNLVGFIFFLCLFATIIIVISRPLLMIHQNRQHGSTSLLYNSAILFYCSDLSFQIQIRSEVYQAALILEAQSLIQGVTAKEVFSNTRNVK